MVDLESLKVYYYESASWNQLTGVIRNFPITKRMDNYAICTVEITDFEGSLYSSWSARDFTEMKIEDANSNVLFRGYLKSKVFSEEGMTLTIHGFAAVLDWKELGLDFVLEDGLVKTVPYGGGTPTSDISDTESPVDICWDGTRFLIGGVTNQEVCEYSKGFIYDQSHDVSGHVTTMGCIFAMDGYIYLGDTNNSAIMKCNANDMSWIENSANKVNETACFDGTYIFATKNATDEVYVIDPYEAPWDSVTDFGVAGAAGPTGICTDGTYLYVVGNDNNVVVQYDKTSPYNPTGTSFSVNGEMTDPRGIEYVDGVFYIVDNNDEKIYRYTAAGVYIDTDYMIEMKQDDEDAGYPDFTWTNDYWGGDKDVGLLIQDNTHGNSSETYVASAVTPTDHLATRTYGTAADTATLPGFYCLGDYGVDGTWDAYVELTVEGDDIPDTNTLQKITLTFRYSILFLRGSGGSIDYMHAYLKIKKDTDWITIGDLYFRDTGSLVPVCQWGEVTTVELTTDLSEYLDKTGANYDSLKGVKFEMDGDSYYANVGAILVHYFSALIEFNSDDISPVMVPIETNGATWLRIPSLDLTESGIQEDDIFQIGQNTTSILGAISQTSGVPIYIQSTLSKYMARNFKGSNCMEGLRAVCLLEGLHWAEDHENGYIVISKEADFVDSAIDITAANYERDWTYEDHCNHYKGVNVYGNASLNIKASKEDADSTSLMYRQVIDDTIMTKSDAQQVADNLFAEIQDKRPSLKLSLIDTDGTYSALEAMKTIGITLARPTVSAADYPIRRLDIERIGEHLKYTIYAGLGSTPEEEKVANFMRESIYMAHKAHTDRLANTPLGAGASIQPSDIAGLDAYIEAVIGDLAILPIGSANAAYYPMMYVSDNSSTKELRGVGVLTNTTATDGQADWYFPFPTTVISKKLYVCGSRVVLGDADAGDKVTRVYTRGVTDSGITNVDDTGVVAYDSADEHDDTFTAIDMSSYNGLVMTCTYTITNAGDLDIAGVFAKIYYDD